MDLNDELASKIGKNRLVLRAVLGSVRMSLDNPNVGDEIVNHISTYVDVT